MIQQNKKLRHIFGALAVAGALAVSNNANAFPGASSSTGSSGSYSSNSFVPAPDHGKTEVTIGDISVKCTNATSIAAGVVSSEAGGNSLSSSSLEESDSVRFGVTISHIFGASQKSCERLASMAKHQAEMNLRASWFNTVRQTCREDLSKDTSALEVLHYYKALSSSLLGYRADDEARGAADLCMAIHKNSP